MKIAFLSALLASCICINGLAHAQNQVASNIKLHGITRHLDKDWLIHYGAEIDIDYYLSDHTIIRAAAAAYQDSGGLLAGFFHLGGRLEAEKFKNVFFRIGIGPTLIWRENWWIHKNNYKGNLFYGKTPSNNEYEWAFLWYGGDMELEWRYAKNKSVLYSMIPGYPIVFNNSIGVRWYF